MTTNEKYDEQIVVQEATSVRARIDRLRTAMAENGKETGGDGRRESEAAACRRLFRVALPILEKQYGIPADA